MLPKILDCYCCAGGATRGYQLAGFYVVGIDINPQPNYIGDDFIQGDVIDILTRLLLGESIQAKSGEFYKLDDFIGIHASPPCQRYSEIQKILKSSSKWPDLVDPTRQLLIETGKPWVMENVEGAPLRVDLMLCGSMFGLGMIRHRIFESNFLTFVLVPPCHHDNMYDLWHYGTNQRVEMAVGMGINWTVTRQEVREAIPPAYTEFIGNRLQDYLR